MLYRLTFMIQTTGFTKDLLQNVSNQKVCDAVTFGTWSALLVTENRKLNKKLLRHLVELNVRTTPVISGKQIYGCCDKNLSGSVFFVNY